jgi:hypothetical protein
MGIDIKDVDYIKGVKYGKSTEPVLVRDWSVAEEKKAKRKYVEPVHQLCTTTHRNPQGST